MLLNFTKMHGCGNDYIYINGFETDIKNLNDLAKKLSERHFSVGADGLIAVCPSQVADGKMRMFNADGSEGKMCGNGVRCVAKFIYDNNICKRKSIKIETLSGIKTIDLIFDGEKVIGGKVDMGNPELTPAKIPVISEEKQSIINKKTDFGPFSYNITCVSMGNPHCVIFVDKDFDLWNFDIEKDGRIIETHSIFPDKVNVEFVKFIDKTHLEMRVWERGSGETYACGTGTCASVVAAVLNKLCEKNTDISVKLRGGILKVNYTDNNIFLTGEAINAYYGRVEI